jgi:DNA-binding SARP family transcriptional activator
MPPGQEVAVTGLFLNLLGPYSAALDGQPLPSFRTRLAQALFIYLACEPERHRREHLMALFWPGLPQASAQQNLRQNLYLLRRAITEVAAAAGQVAVPLVLADSDTLQLNPAAAVVVDARRFAALIDRIRPGLGELEEAVALYRGDFLADFYLPDSNPFEEWAAARREAYRRGALLALERLTAIHLTDENFAAAEAYARRQLAVDPLHEAGNRQLIELLARDGRRSAALAHFDDYRRLLNVELGVTPGSETLALVSAVQGGELLPAARRPAHSSGHIRGYDIHEELGRGSYGVVFRASQPAIGRDVAIKVIPARYADDVAFIRRFEAEAQTIARLEHPQIVPLYDYWREPGSAYLVMRYLRGGNLKAALNGAPWPVERVARLLDQVAAALAVAHRHSVVHRDVKPANVLLDDDGNAYLTDFGIAKLLQPEGGAPLSLELFAGTPEYVSPEQALNEPVTPLSDQYSLALVAYEALSGRPPFAAGSLLELLEMHAREPVPPLRARRPDVPAAVDGVLARALAKRPADRFPDVAAFAAAFATAFAAAQGEPLRAAAGEPLLAVDNPYKGLLAFTEADAALFYGREALTQRLVERLAEAEDHHRFLTVVGPSGSGKSSLVKAGLVPALRRGALPGADKWFVLGMVPGAHPFEELETALLRIAVNPPASLLDQLQDGERGLLRAVRRVLPSDGELLLIIDQFEELFTLVADREVTARFLNGLIAAISDPRSPLRVVATLRADFYDRPLLHSGLSEVMQQRTEVVIPMTADELVRAIERPAAQVGVVVQPELVAALVAEVNEQPGALPLLQYTLSELFEERADDRLTLDAYRQLGGIGGALAQRADAVYDALDAPGQTAARALFSRLVTLGEGVEDTRRRVLLSEIETLEYAGGQGGRGDCPGPPAPPLPCSPARPLRPRPPPGLRPRPADARADGGDRPRGAAAGLAAAARLAG